MASCITNLNASKIWPSKEHALIWQLRGFDYHVKLLIMLMQMILHRRQSFILLFQTYIYLPLHSYHLLMECITSE